MKIIVATLLTIFFIQHAHAYETKAVISGIAKIRDGDGILFGELEIRLRGIAAPEFNKKKKEIGGSESKDNLRKLINDKFVICHLDGTTTRKRPVGICYVNGVEVNHHQVKTGHARDCPRFSKGRYREAELTAQKAGNNLSSTYKLPDYCIKR